MSKSRTTTRIPASRRYEFVPFRRSMFKPGTKAGRGQCSYANCAKRPRWARLGGFYSVAYCGQHAAESNWPVPPPALDEPLPDMVLVPDEMAAGVPVPSPRVRVYPRFIERMLGGR